MHVFCSVSTVRPRPQSEVIFTGMIRNKLRDYTHASNKHTHTQRKKTQDGLVCHVPFESHVVREARAKLTPNSPVKVALGTATVVSQRQAAGRNQSNPRSSVFQWRCLLAVLY